MKLYTVCFQSGDFFTIYATHFKKETPHGRKGIGIPKIVFCQDDRQICSVPRGLISEIYTLPIFSTEREVVFKND